MTQGKSKRARLGDLEGGQWADWLLILAQGTALGRWTQRRGSDPQAVELISALSEPPLPGASPAQVRTGEAWLPQILQPLPLETDLII